MRDHASGQNTAVQDETQEGFREDDPGKAVDDGCAT